MTAAGSGRIRPRAGDIRMAGSAHVAGERRRRAGRQGPRDAGPAQRLRPCRAQFHAGRSRGRAARQRAPAGANFDAVTANVDLTHAAARCRRVRLAQEVRRARHAARSAMAATSERRDPHRRHPRRWARSSSARRALDAAGGIQGVDIERMYSRDTIDLRGAVTRRQDGGYRVALNGPFFDASPWMDGILDMSGGPGRAPRPLAAPAMPGPAVSSAAQRRAPEAPRQCGDPQHEASHCRSTPKGRAVGTITGRDRDAARTSASRIGSTTASATSCSSPTMPASLRACC